MSLYNFCITRSRRRQFNSPWVKILLSAVPILAIIQRFSLSKVLLTSMSVSLKIRKASNAYAATREEMALLKFNLPELSANYDPVCFILASLGAKCSVR